MSNGTIRLSAAETDALLRRSALLWAKVTSLVQEGFSHDEAMQILFADIEAGLTEFGTAPSRVEGAAPVPLSEDLSQLVGNWKVTPPIDVVCGDWSLVADTLEFSFLGEGQERGALVFRDQSGASDRASGEVANLGASRFEFLGRLQSKDVRIRIRGRIADGKLDINFGVEFEGGPFGSRCQDEFRNRVLERRQPRTVPTPLPQP